ncbi:unnamed protein product [Candida verbasci]|uniref:Uncharacterized protein n=1 Tax=Candida verbasci TaxID=1227364 RepID=A0A9W4TXS5_9ASCO|nr:unnamed protein product [Candida verbasci]
MNKAIELIILCIFMTITTFGSSIVPLKISNTSYTNINVLSHLSAGIILGTAFMIIIPEGMEMMQENINSLSVGLPLIFGFITMYGLEIFTNHASFKQNTVMDSLSLSFILHGIVDGISLGSSFIIDSDMSLFIYLAIIIHKLPTAFSLSTLLMKNGLSLNKIYWQLCYFALSTPLSSIIIYTISSIFKFENTGLFIGLLFLFSGGNFIYIINHIHNDDEFEELPTTEESNTTVTPKSETRRIYWELAGLIIPILLSFIKD